ncbi:hypothetical protein APB06_32170, partial [Pseudomonas aeruginosa]
ISKAATQMADIGNELGIVIQDITHGIERIARRRVQRRLIDQMLRYRERVRLAHNRPYVTRRPEPPYCPGGAQHKAEHYAKP